MPTIAELIARRISPEDKETREPRVETLSSPICPRSEKPHDRYEADVFNFLWLHRERLGIKSVLKYTARLVDGGVVLVDGTKLVVEVKYRMNWEKACQAEFEFRQFQKRFQSEAPDGGLVFFEEFSGDWARKAGRRNLENGWSHWYRDHAEVNGRRMDLLRLFKRQDPAGDSSEWALDEGSPLGDAILVAAASPTEGQPENFGKPQC
ncbi:MAG: hypothetical protein J2P46_02095 [Zavarzinella sp.]|nr:hypothetical protein [Zavarzinella sp.]